MATDNVWVRADEHGSGLLVGWGLHRADLIRSVEIVGGMLSIRLTGETRHLQVGRRMTSPDPANPDPAGQLVQLIAAAAEETTPMVVEDRGGELWAGPVQDAIAHHAEQEAKEAAELAASIDWTALFGDGPGLNPETGRG